MRVLSGALAGRPFLSILTGDSSLRSRPMRRVVGAVAGDGGTRRRPGRRRVRAARDPRRTRCAACATSSPVASAQVKSALMLAGLQAERDDRDRVARAEPRSQRADARRARRAGGGRRPLRVACEPGAPQPFQLDVPGDPSSAAFFVVGALDHSGIRSHDRVDVVEPDAPGLRRGVAPHGRRHRDRADGRAVRRAGRRAARALRARSPRR